MISKIFKSIVIIIALVAIALFIDFKMNKADTTAIPITQNDISITATTTNTTPQVSSSTSMSSATTYTNSKYGFTLDLPNSWNGYTATDTKIKYGYSVTLRHPKWTTSVPRMDIPILVYPIKQWNIWLANNFEGYPTAAPIGPTEVGRNSKYVFATAPRYNFSFATGFEEVVEIIKTLKGF